MNQVQSNIRSRPALDTRDARETKSAVERLTERRASHGSGFYVVVDEYAGLDRLDRTELDETDADS